MPLMYYDRLNNQHEVDLRFLNTLRSEKSSSFTVHNHCPNSNKTTASAHFVMRVHDPNTQNKIFTLFNVLILFKYQNMMKLK